MYKQLGKSRQLEEGEEIIASLISDYEICIESCSSKNYLKKFGEICLRFCSLEKFINTLFYLG